MRNYRKQKWLVSIFTMMFLGCSVLTCSVFAADKTLIRLATSAPNDINTHEIKHATVFANYVNDNSDTMKVKIFSNSKLGETRSVIEAMQLGSGASATIGGAGEYAAFNKQLGVLGLPFIWKDLDHVHSALNGEVGESLGKTMEPIGFKVLAWGTSWGFRNVATTDKKVTKASDLVGLKLRTIPNEVFVGAVNAMGANATPMNFGEVYTSLESGVLDGMEHTATTIMGSKLDEVIKYYTLTRHICDPAFLVMSLQVWNKFSPEEQKILLEGAKKGAEVVQSMAQEREGSSYQKLAKSGVEISEIDTAPMVEKSVPTQDELAEKIGANDILLQIRAL